MPKKYINILRKTMRYRSNIITSYFKKGTKYDTQSSKIIISAYLLVNST